MLFILEIQYILAKKLPGVIHGTITLFLLSILAEDGIFKHIFDILYRTSVVMIVAFILGYKKELIATPAPVTLWKLFILLLCISVGANFFQITQLYTESKVAAASSFVYSVLGIIIFSFVMRRIGSISGKKDEGKILE